MAHAEYETQSARKEGGNVDSDFFKLIEKKYGPLTHLTEGTATVVFLGKIPKPESSQGIPAVFKFLKKNNPFDKDANINHNVFFHSEKEFSQRIYTAEMERNRSRSPKERTRYFPEPLHWKTKEFSSDVPSELIVSEFMPGESFGSFYTRTRLLSPKDRADLFFQVCDAQALSEQAQSPLGEGLKDTVVEIIQDTYKIHFFDFQLFGQRTPENIQKKIKEKRKELVTDAFGRIYNVRANMDDLPALESLPLRLKEILLGVVFEDTGESTQEGSINYAAKYPNAEKLVEDAALCLQEISEKAKTKDADAESRVNARIKTLISRGEQKKYTHLANNFSHIFRELTASIDKMIPAEKEASYFHDPVDVNDVGSWANNENKVAGFCTKFRSFLVDTIPKMTEKNLPTFIQKSIIAEIQSPDQTIPPLYTPPPPIQKMSFLHSEKKTEFNRRSEDRYSRIYRNDEIQQWKKTTTDVSGWQTYTHHKLMHGLASFTTLLKKSTTESNFPQAGQTIEKEFLQDLISYRDWFLKIMQKTYLEDTADFREEIEWCQREIATKRTAETPQPNPEETTQEPQEKMEAAWCILKIRIEEINKRLDQEGFDTKLPIPDLDKIIKGANNEALLLTQQTLPLVHEVLTQSIIEFEEAGQAFEQTKTVKATAAPVSRIQKALYQIKEEEAEQHFTERTREHEDFTNFLTTTYGLVEKDEKKYESYNNNYLTPKREDSRHSRKRRLSPNPLLLKG